MKKASIEILIILLIDILTTQKLRAQLNPMGPIYFQNQYLGNPAMAGTRGININLGYRKQWNRIPGSPITQSFTTDYAVSNRTGLALNINNDKSGLFKRLRSAATYAYHLPLNNNNQRISFGLSFVYLHERINAEDVRGDQDDPMVADYNRREAYLDGDFGLAYTTSKLTLQFAVPNLKGPLKMDDVRGTLDRSTFFSALSYKIPAGIKNDLEIEPKAVYRGVNGLPGILDLGARFSFAENKLNLFGMYHSTNSASAGLEIIHESVGFSCMYNSSTSALSTYTSGNFEFGLRVNLSKKNLCFSFFDPI